MELQSQEGEEMPIVPINTSYGGHGHVIHHDHYPAAAATQPNNLIIPVSSAPPSNGLDDNPPYCKKTVVRYRECLKNHAASMGGNATDGCGEFMPSGEEGSLEALTCSACNCHRNFHRKEVEGECFSPNPYHQFNRFGRRVIVGHHHHHHHPLGAIIPAASRPHQMILSGYNSNNNMNMGCLPSSDQSDDQEDGHQGGSGVGLPQIMKKRFRTKFTPEQKEKMQQFAEKVGWKIQKQEESVVQQFCQEVGVKRRVLKVWMHNNKHNLAKKNNDTNNNNNDIIAQTHQVNLD